MIPNALDGLTGTGPWLATVAKAPGSFMDALPDPMKLDPYQIGFVILLMTALYLFLKFAFFQPLTRVMDDRDSAIAAGDAAKAEAAAQVEQRQADYAARLRELRAKAFEHRKALAAAAADEKGRVLNAARQEAAETRSAALASLAAQKESAKVELLKQVDALAESMVQHLLKQA